MTITAVLCILVELFTAFIHHAHALQPVSAGKLIHSENRRTQSTALSRRDSIQAGFASFGACALPGIAQARPFLTEDTTRNEVAVRPEAGRTYFPAITPPFWNRATLRYTLGGNMWAFEQLLTFANVTATIRSNVVRLEDGSLWVSSPVYPTGELCALLDELPGEVRHIVLSCNAFEHKAALRDFARRYPNADVWVAPGQYGPLGGTFQGTSFSVLPPPASSERPAWSSEIDYKVLFIDIPENAGPVSEVAFFHRPTKTLLVTDAVVFIPNRWESYGGGEETNIFSTYFDRATIADPSFWPRTVLQAVFLPLRQNEDGSFPGFDRIANRLVRAPILRGFNDARGAPETRQWIAAIAADWKFDRIVTSHFASPITAGPNDLLDTFSYLFDDDQTGASKREDVVYCRDWELLNGLNEVIAQYGLGAPALFDYSKGCIP